MAVLHPTIEGYYSSGDKGRNNFVANMTIDYKSLNDCIDLFTDNYAVLVTKESDKIHDMVSFSLQSQNIHHIANKMDHHLMWNGNLIKVDKSACCVYNIASKTMYQMPRFLNSDRKRMGVCASARRGIFAIGG
eukprot:334955_1